MRLKENKKMQLLFCVLSVVLIWCVYAVLSIWIKGSIEKEKAFAREESFDSKVLLWVENASMKSGKLNVYGWASRYESELSKIYVVLRATDGSGEHVFKARLSENITGSECLEKVKMEEIGSVSCFDLEVEDKKIKKNVCYEILIDLTYTVKSDDEKREYGIKITAAKYLYEGEVYGYNPIQFQEPKFIDEKMKEVVSGGVLRGYDMENGSWIYLYEGDLYWILDTMVEQNKDENLYMFFHLYTLEPSFLPETCRTSEFDNKDFSFKSKELEMGTDSQYRVAKVTLETKYPITYIHTGQYKEKKNIWSLKTQIIVGE